MLITVSCQKTNDQLIRNANADIDIYYGIADDFVSNVPVYYNYLSDYEKKRANNFKFETDRNCYISLHALLRVELSGILKTTPASLVIEKTEAGKSFVPGLKMPISISRSRNLFAFVIGRGRQIIGIDIEKMKFEADFPGIVKNYFSVKEQQLIFSTDDTDDQIRNFLEIWTRKEALLKAIGIGLSVSLDKIQLIDGENYIEIENMKIKSDKFKILSIIKGMSLLSVASSEGFNPKFKNFSILSNK